MKPVAPEGPRYQWFIKSRVLAPFPTRIKADHWAVDSVRRIIGGIEIYIYFVSPCMGTIPSVASVMQNLKLDNLYLISRRCNLDHFTRYLAIYETEKMRNRVIKI